MLCDKVEESNWCTLIRGLLRRSLFKQESGHKRVSTALLAIQNIKVVSMEHLKQKLSLETTNVDVIMTFTSPKQYFYSLCRHA